MKNIRQSLADAQRIRSYSKMKNSGLPWVEQIPAHWELLPNRALVRQRKHVVGDRHPNFQLLSLTKQGVIVRDLTTMKGKFSEDMGTSQEVRPGDLIFCMFDVPETPRTVGLSQHNGMITGAYTVLETIGRCSKEFFEAFYLAMDNQKLLSPLYSGLRNTIPLPRFLQTKTPVPPESEQVAIVGFLDHIDRRIRRYVRAKQKLIKLLEEQKQAIINRAVTRGLDPKVRLNSSSVELIGDVPEHWELRRLKSLVYRIDQGISPQAENCLAEGERWGVLKAGCVNHGVFRELEHKQLPVGFEVDPDFAIAPGDILVSRASGSPHLVGSVGRIVSLTFKLILSDKTFRPVFLENVDPDFMVLAMNSRYYRDQVQRAISGAEGLANNLPLSSLRGFSFAIPPHHEQKAIVRNLQPIVNGLLTSLHRVVREISVLHEYRIRLIADVVTGKLDVRDVAARLTIEREEFEPFDDSDPDISLDVEPTDALDETLEPIEA